jgi:phosphatidylglycerol:prolipoprotein diacylglycerol transferase
MHPILVSLKLTPETARIAALLAVLFLSAFIVWDGKKNRKLAIVQAVLFFGVAFSAAWFFVTPERLPPEVVIDIRSWGLFVVLGMVTCFFIQRKLGREIGLSSEHILSLWVYGGIGAVVGARALHVLVNWSWYAPNPATAIAFWDGGMVYIGGVTVSVSVAIVYAYLRGLNVRAFDVLALGIALTQGIGRIGCFLAGCCYGAETTLPFGVRFPEGSIAHYTMMQTGVLAPGATHTASLHPTQLYEALACFCIGGILLYWYKKKTPRPGMIICGYFIFYSVARFLLELLRNDPERQFFLGFSTSQLAGIALVLISGTAAVLITVMKRDEHGLRGPVANHDV